MWWGEEARRTVDFVNSIGALTWREEAAKRLVDCCDSRGV